MTVELINTEFKDCVIKEIFDFIEGDDKEKRIKSNKIQELLEI